MPDQTTHEAPKHGESVAKSPMTPAHDDAPAVAPPKKAAVAPVLEPKDLAFLAASMGSGTVANHGGNVSPELAEQLIKGAQELLTAAANAEPPEAPAPSTAPPAPAKPEKK